MKVLIIYFSQTGNTHKIAIEIQNGILESGNICELVKIKDAKKKNLEIYDLIGIGTPTFFYREPKNVQIFIRTMKEVNNKQCFLFCSHGSQIGNTFYYMKEDLIRKGYIVIDTFDSYASTSIQFYPKPMHTECHPDNIELNKAKEFGKNICNLNNKLLKFENDSISSYEKLGLIPQIKLITEPWWAEESKKLTSNVLRNISPKFKINIDKCTKCLKCQNECPVNAIDIEASPPEIQKNGCIFCWYCEKLCPNNAIEADWSLMTKNAKKNLLKYIEILEKAEKRGKFRPYVDYRKIH